MSAFNQEFEDDNMPDFEKHPDDFLLNLSEEHYDFRKYFPSVDEELLYPQCQESNQENIMELTYNACMLNDNIEEIKYAEVPIISKEISTSKIKQVDPRSCIQKCSTEAIDAESINIAKHSKNKREWRKVQCAKVRWSKEDDRHMFNTLCRLAQQQNISLKESLEEKHLSTEFKDILIQVKELHHWRGSIYVLRKRIKFIFSKPCLSAREERDLKQMLRKEAAGKISIDKILMQFPGKSEDMILNFRAEFNEKMRNLTSL